MLPPLQVLAGSSMYLTFEVVGDLSVQAQKQQGEATIANNEDAERKIYSAGYF